MKKHMMFGFAAIAALSLTACDNGMRDTELEEERIGEGFERESEEAGNVIRDGAENIGDEAEELGNEAEGEAEELGNELDEVNPLTSPRPRIEND